MNKKILIPLVIVLVVGGYAGYSMATAKKPAKQRIAGTIYVLPKQFTLNMSGGQYATLTVGLDLAASQTIPAADPNNAPPDGFGNLPEEAAVRAIITNAVTGQPASALITAGGRAKLESEILHTIKTKTDVEADGVYFTDVAVQ
jgi:flagellar FliL protein